MLWWLRARRGGDRERKRKETLWVLLLDSESAGHKGCFCFVTHYVLGEGAWHRWSQSTSCVTGTLPEARMWGGRVNE